MPSIRQLEYLVALYDKRHFRRAAERVGVSQPTLSAQLKALEDGLGARLVERNRSGVIFTPFANEIIPIARRIMRDVQELRQTASSYGEEFGGTIRLGLPPTIGPYLLPRMLPDLHHTYPNLRLYVREELPMTLPLALQDGRHDVLITPLPVRGAEFTVVPVFREPLFIAFAADHPLAQADEITRADLAGQSILTLETGHHLHEQAEAICEEFGAQLRLDFEGTSLDTLRQMVAMGVGCSLLPGLYVHTMLQLDDSVKALRIRGRALFRTVGVAWRSTSTLRSQFEKLAGHVASTIERDFPGFPRL
jgi:LysR family hydrogen peroxide-inducible transcriptional activator